MQKVRFIVNHREHKPGDIMDVQNNDAHYLKEAGKVEIIIEEIDAPSVIRPQRKPYVMSGGPLETPTKRPSRIPKSIKTKLVEDDKPVPADKPIVKQKPKTKKRKTKKKKTREMKSTRGGLKYKTK